MKKLILLVVFQLALIVQGAGQSSRIYDDNINIRLAHQAIYALKTGTAEKLLQAEEKANPENAYVIFYRFYAEVIDLLISNSPEKYKKTAPKLEASISKLEALPHDAPDYKMLLGEAKAYYGMLSVKYGNKLSGIIECLKGYKLLDSNGKAFPEFVQNNKIPGVIHIAVSFVPRVLRWAISIFGIKGDPVTGLKELADYSKFVEGKPGMKEEAFLLRIGAYKIMGQDEMLVKMIRIRINEFKDMTLLNYLASTICLESNDAETAIAMLSDISADKLETPFHPIFYLTGKAKLFRLDPDADISMKRFLQESNGPDYQKATLYNLACLALASGDKNEYLNYISQVKLKGREFSSRDIEAQYEAQSKTIPNVDLMRAGLLLRGGYPQRALPELIKVRNMTDLTLEEQVRFHFLYGESYRLMNNSVEAEKSYLMAINSGYEKGLDNAQYAIIQLALMKEKNGNKKEAEKYFKQCLDFKSGDSPYADIYRNKAKAGLIRISNSIPSGLLSSSE